MSRIYLPPSVLRFDPHYKALSSWVDHAPFGYDLVAAARPKMLVEIGTQTGLSYFTFCQSIKESGIDSLSYAIASFEESSQLDDSTFSSINDHNRQHYHGFSYLVRMRFTEALQHFNEESIDLLHINNLHAQEEISAAFSSWYPKIKSGGLILIHNVQARENGYEVWKFWEEICRQYKTFTFKSGFGLGVLRKAGGDHNKDPELLKLLFEEQTEDSRAHLQAFYAHAHQHLVNTRTLKSLTHKTIEPT
jgi:hypothetical protein